MALAPDFRGGYAGEQTVTTGGGYDPFAPQNYTGPISPDFRGGYAGDQTVSSGGGYEPPQGRDLGTTVTALKPDGTAIDSTGIIPSILKSSTVSTTGSSSQSATVTPTSISASGKSSTSAEFPEVISNPLENYASYSVLWTMASLTVDQFNDPSTYRNNPAELSYVVFSSAGRYDERRVSTWYGTPEYFVNNFTMRAVIAPTQRTGNTNAFKFEFDIYEPYSMGLFLQSLQRAAGEANHIDYLTAPFVMVMDFVGYDETGKNYRSVKSKYFVMKLISVKFQVNESGSSYKVEAIPFNHHGFTDEINTAYNDLKIIGGSQGTVEEILTLSPNSLTSVLNNIEEELVKSKKIGVADVYEIQFPEAADQFQSVSQQTGTNSATCGTIPQQQTVVGSNKVPVSTPKANEIGKSSLGFDASSGGNVPFMNHGNVVDPETGVVLQDQMVVDPKNRTFQFAQGQSLTEIITRTVLNSEYAVEAIKEQNYVDGGFVKWFKVDVQIEFLGLDDIIGDYARKYTYRVVPYLIHHTVFTNVNTPPLGYDQIKTTVCKRYDYIYTGQNVDIVKFDIEINNLFYVGIAPSSESDSGLVVKSRHQRIRKRPTYSSSETGKGTTPAAAVPNIGRKRTRRDPTAFTRATSGSGHSKTEQEIAESFHKAFIEGTSADLVKVNLEILGDPYWIVDSGLANYFSPGAGQKTLDECMNYEAGDVFIYLSFRSPTDINEFKGTYEFSKVGREGAFSGIYRVILCESQFSDGMFKQKLECIRMPGQAIDYLEGGKPASNVQPVNSDTMATQVGTNPYVPPHLISR